MEFRAAPGYGAFFSRIALSSSSNIHSRLMLQHKQSEELSLTVYLSHKMMQLMPLQSFQLSAITNEWKQ